MACFNYQTISPGLLYLIVMIIMCSTSSFAELQKFEHPPKGDGSLSFLVIGDWGRKGSENQSEVAVQMGKVAKQLDIDFVVSTGDNFYDDGLKGVTDPNFEESFSRIYTASSLKKPWYSVLGNHDYRGDVRAQLSPILRKIDNRWICKRSFVLHAEIAEFFFMDTTPLVDMYFDPFEDHIYDWRGVLPRHNYISNLLKNLESSLKESTAKWKIVVGHHAIRSVGHHGNTQELIRHVLPILQANNVDFYMNGHDHCLEHLSTQDSSIQFFTSGAGSKAWRGDVKGGQVGNGGIEFFYDGQGFMSVQLNQSDAQFVFYDVSGKVLHQWKTSKAHLHSAI